MGGFRASSTAISDTPCVRWNGREGSVRAKTSRVLTLCSCVLGDERGRGWTGRAYWVQASLAVGVPAPAVGVVDVVVGDAAAACRADRGCVWIDACESNAGRGPTGGHLVATDSPNVVCLQPCLHPHQPLSGKGLYRRLVADRLRPGAAGGMAGHTAETRTVRRSSNGPRQQLPG